MASLAVHAHSNRTWLPSTAEAVATDILTGITFNKIN